MASDKQTMLSKLPQIELLILAEKPVSKEDHNCIRSFLTLTHFCVTFYISRATCPIIAKFNMRHSIA